MFNKGSLLHKMHVVFKKKDCKKLKIYVNEVCFTILLLTLPWFFFTRLSNSEMQFMY